MKIIKGDIIQLMNEAAFSLMVHGCNCWCTMNSGIARAVRDNFPHAWHTDQQTIAGDQLKLGDITVGVHVTDDGDSFLIVNGYIQYYYGKDKRYADYDAIRSVFNRIKTTLPGYRIAYPKIGAGLAGGDWDIISKIIDEELEGEDHTLVLYNK